VTPTAKRFGFATLLAFDLVLFAPLLVTGGVFSSHDFVRAHHPWRQGAHGVLEAENRLLSDPAASGQTTLVRFRRFPSGFFWNPWVSAGGMGPFQLAQGFLSPFVALPALLLPEAWIETGILFLKFNFAFLAAYFFLRSRRFSDLAAAAGAAAWAFATGQTVWGLWMHSSVSATYPLLLMAVDRAFEEPRTARALRFGTLSILLCLSGGFPHWILYGAFGAGLYALLRAIELRGRGFVRAVFRLAASTAVAVAILVPSILATARFLEASEYASLRREMGGKFPLPLRHLRLYFVPDYAGTPRGDDYTGIGWIPGDNFIETSVGVGLAAGGLAFVGLAALRGRGRRRLEALYAVLLGAAIAIPLYAGGPLLSAVGSLPFLEISLFARAKILILFAVGLLVACGVEALERLANGVDALERTAAASEGRSLALRTAPFLIAVPLAFHALDFYPECRPEDAVFEDTPGIVRLRELTSGGWRFAAAGWTLLPNISEAVGLEDARGHFTLDARYRQLLAGADPNSFGTYGTYLVLDPLTLDPSARALDLASVRYLAAPPGVASPIGPEVEERDAAPFHPKGAIARTPREVAAAALPRVYAGDDLTIFERPAALPRFRLDGEGSVRILELEPERFAIETDAAEPARLSTSQKAFAPYWELFLDGNDVTLEASRGLFFELAVPAGRHRVEGRFRLPRAEAAASLFGLGALAAIMIAAPFPRSRTRTP
jgi:hypothetical protein